MNLPIGFAMVLGLVLGGFILSGGKLDIILHALPYEGMMIGGMAVGTFIIANSFSVQKKTLSGLARVVKGERWKKQDYEDALLLMFEMSRILKAKGIQSLEPDMEEPGESELFGQFPRIQNDRFTMDLICDTLKAMSLNMTDPHETEDLIKRRLRAHHHGALGPVQALTKVADALPAIGIVAAVLGVIKTMSAVDSPPAVLGAKIAGALVGTMLGVFLSYGLVGPVASRLQQIEENDAAFYKVFETTLLALLHEDSPLICVEKGRSCIPDGFALSFNDIEEKTREVKVA